MSQTTPTPQPDILVRLKIYDEYGPLSSVAIHEETPGYSTGRLYGDARDARAEIERLRAAIDAAVGEFLRGYPASALNFLLNAQENIS